MPDEIGVLGLFTADCDDFAHISRRYAILAVWRRVGLRFAPWLSWNVSLATSSLCMLSCRPATLMTRSARMLTCVLCRWLT